ncbi:hypothetical protein BOTNAR_0036g00230 [Botryotinia narcissicola]|uniref:2EXR domain-containing protein n=1 Tax=Botryotinia narcissicola TaxID=278944 RepID=A0A4Z1JFM7_9HELO|nr:hypothetical protein BOTNAR_0036g00230 [Botryotinia narcissicola]
MDHSATMTPKPSSGSVAKKSQSKKSRAKKSRAKKAQAVKKSHGVDQGSQTIVSPTEFTLFPNLPLEVRRQIWRSSFETGRKVELRDGYIRTTPRGEYLPYDAPYEQRSRDRLVCMQHKISPISHVPVAFVNRESRTETLRHYMRLYQDLHAPEHGPNLRYPCTIYFNPKIDIPLFFANKPQHMFDRINLSLERLFPSYDTLAAEAMKSIRHVEIEFAGLYESNRDSYDLDSCRDALSMFENLESVLIMSTNLRPNPSFDIKGFLAQYFSRDENDLNLNRATPVRLSYCSPPRQLLELASPSSPEAHAKAVAWIKEQ